VSGGIVWLLVLAGGAGAVTRFGVDGVLTARTPGYFPWATLVINLTGSLLLGVLTGLTLHHGSPADVKAVLGTGFCGGYTTFSTASVEAVRLARRGDLVAALTQLVASAGGTLAAAALGIQLAS